MLGAEGPDSLVCSRRECERPAHFRVLWRNPKIHAADRTKVWLSCEGHGQFFTDYLGQRDFPVRLEPMSDAP